MNLSDHTDAGAVLTGLARSAIASALGLPATPPPADWLGADGASFVTLTQDGVLRGCIGSLQAWRPLRDDVTANAVAAAIHDPRFKPLARPELAVTHIEVSVLSPSQPMPFTSMDDALSQLRPGVDGVILSVGQHRATFLPQVWVDLPEPARFIGQLLRKAGLAANDWGDDVKISRYTVTAFSEADA